MNRLNKIMKVVLAALFIAALPNAAFAEHQRTPNPRPIPRQTGMSPQAVANFLKAVHARDNGENNRITGAPVTSNTRPVISQRPGRIMKSPDAPGGNIYALVPYHSRSTSYYDGYYAKLNLNNYSLTPELQNPNICNGSDYYFQTGAERNGILYIPAYSENMITGEVTIYWKAFDTTTGQQLPDIVFPAENSSLQAYFYGMTYDPVNDMFYGLSIDVTNGQYGTLVSVDPKQPKWTPKAIGFVGSAYGDAVCCIAYNPLDQMLYGLKDGGELVKIDVNEFDIITVQLYDDFNEYFMFPENATANAFCYSPYDHAFMTVYRDSYTQKMILASVDAETYEAYELGEITPLGYICALVCRDPYASDEAPDKIAEPIITFDKAATDGTYTIHTPSTTFGGIAINNDITVYVLVDGQEIDSFTAKPDTDYTKALNVTAGLHEMEIYATIGDNASPKTTVAFYAGYDSTLAPTNLALNQNVLTWTAPSAVGAHGGYVDMDNLTYNVYFNGDKKNLQPITGTTFKFAPDDQMSRKSITVTAVTQGMESEPSLPLSRTVGVAFDLPFKMQPATASEAALFETYNADSDDNVFQYYTGWDDFNCYTIRTGRYHEMPDDWLFLPAISFDDPDSLYELAFKYGNAFLDERHYDNLDIYIGTLPDPKAMTQKIYSHSERNTPVITDVNVRFTVPEANDYVIGFHSKPGNKTVYRGVILYDFDVHGTQFTTATPAAANDIKLTADKDGELYIDVEFTAPTLDMVGKAIPADTDITVTATTDAGSKSATLKPGAKGKVTVPAFADGFTDVYVSTSSKDGQGPSVYNTVYVGLDTPLAPNNVQYTIDRDNLGFNITWEKPTGGQNGGYINPDDLKYAIYSQGGAGNYNKISDADGLSYHYQINPGTQTYYHVGPVASNEMGSSINGQFVYESLGTPYSTPMVEEWNNAGFTFSKWLFSTDGEYSGVDIQSVSSGVGLGIGDPTFARGGGLCVVSQGGPASRYEILAPRFTTEGIAKAKIGVRVWDYDNSGSVELWARCADNQNYKHIATLDMPHNKGQWLDLEAELPAEYIGQPWVQVNLRGTVPSNGYVLLDNYSAAQDIETDFTVISIDGPLMTMIGDTADFDVIIANSGSEPASTTLTLDILGDGKVIDSKVANVGRTLSGESFEFKASFDMTVDYLKYDKFVARATISDETDENPNNNVISMEFVVNDHALPVIGDLAAARDGQNVVLTWSAPDTSYGSPESFEVMEPFAIKDKLGLWTNVDGDKGRPFAIDGKRFDNDDSPCAWVVWDAVTMNTTSDERLCAHSGRRTLLARSIGYDESSDQPTRSFDWLISPEIVPGTTVSFWYNTLSSQYTETVELWVSYTDDKIDLDNVEVDANGNPIKCGSFTKLRNFTKSGSETWEFCETVPLKGVKYFAFVYSSYGQFGAMLDDIIFTPANDYKWDIDSYEVIRSINYGKPEIIAQGINTLTYSDLNDALNTSYWVRSVVTSDGRQYSSPLSNEVRMTGSSVEQIPAGASVSGGVACVILTNLEGQNVDLYDADGRHLDNVTIRSNNQSVPAPAGVVLVKVNDAYTKVFVK
ncbi:MAG: hypothetical protein K2H86_00345 [Muribaculaceae bacterium]|nr:hypothetical protein [Muribaculaceae bacterium]